MACGSGGISAIRRILPVVIVKKLHPPRKDCSLVPKEVDGQRLSVSSRVAVLIIG